MAITLNELLQPQVITDTISKISDQRGPLSRFFGMHIGGPNIKTIPTRFAEFRIFSHTREPSSFRAPGSGPAVIAPNPAGAQRVAMARTHEKIVLDLEQLGNLSPIVGPNSQVDSGGQDYIFRQESFLAEKFNNAVEVMMAGLIRGSLFLVAQGDNWTPFLTSQSGTQITINWQVPAGNKSQLNMTGGGNIILQSWDDPSAPIIDNVFDIRAAFVQLNAMPLQCALCNSTMWKFIIGNTQVRNVGGTVQNPQESFDYEDATDEDGNPLAGMGVARLRAIPWLKWLIIDDTLSIGGTDPVYATGTGTLTPVVPNNTVIFMPEPGRSWVTMEHGTEHVFEDWGKPMTAKKGFQAWKSTEIEPSRLSIVGLLNFLPVLYRENALAIGTVVF